MINLSECLIDTRTQAELETKRTQAALSDHKHMEIRARDQAGKQVGVSGAYVGMARDINAYKPELKEQVSSGKLSNG